MLELKLVQQDKDWNCSLACINMILNSKNIKTTLQQLTKSWIEKDHEEVLWTIDIFYLLREYGVETIFYTDYLGVRPSYSSEKFYQEAIEKDEIRVNQLFSNALEKKLSVEKR